MPQVILDYGVNVTGTEKTVSDLRKEYAALNKELGKTVQGSKEYYQVLNQMATTKADLQDIREEIKALDPGEKLAAIGSIAKGAVGAYTSLTSAVAIFAGSNDELQKQLLKVNAALGLLQGAQQVISTLDEGKRILTALTISTKAQTAATEGATVATKSFGAALKAAGIGLVITTLAILAANWEKVKKAVTDIFPALNNIGELFDSLMQKLYGVGNVIKKVFQGDFNIAANFAEGVARKAAEQAEEAYNKMLDVSIKAVDNEIAVLKARGNSTYDLERTNLKRRLDLYKDNADEYNKVLQQIRLLDAAHEKEQEDERKKANDKYIADLKKRNEEIQKAEEERLKILIDANSKVLTVQQQQSMNALNEVITTGQQQTEVESNNYSERFGKFNEFAEKVITGTVERERQVTDAEKQSAELQMQFGSQLLQHKEQALDTTANLMKAGARLAGENSKLGKALAITGTLIDTYRGAQAAFTGMTSTIPGPVGIALGVAAAAAAVAGGLANVAAIKKADTGGGGGSAVSIPSYTAPRVQTSAALTRLDTPSIENISDANANKPIQVSISVDEVTKTQNRVNNYENNSTIG